jgi:hypothetical protein
MVKLSDEQLHAPNCWRATLYAIFTIGAGVVRSLGLVAKEVIDRAGH